MQTPSALLIIAWRISQSPDDSHHKRPVLRGFDVLTVGASNHQDFSNNAQLMCSCWPAWSGYLVVILMRNRYVRFVTGILKYYHFVRRSQNLGLCNIGYPSETHLQIKSREIWFVHDIHISSLITSDFCTEHGGITAMLCAKFRNDWVTA